MGIEQYEEASRGFEDAELRLRAAERADVDLALDFLAGLSPLDYDRERKKEAERLGVRVSQLDRSVEKRRQQQLTSRRSGDGVQLVDVEASKDPVNGDRMLSRLVETIERHVILPLLAAVAIALWIIRAHAHECFDVNTRLGLCSPDKRCGKTTLLEVLAALTPRALLVSNVTPATLFRVIEATHPTLLIDELDSFKDAHEELRGIMNSGHRRAAAFVLRCAGDEHDVKSFSTWCPMTYAMIGDPPDTLKDRSIIIHMRRRAQHENIHHLRWTGRRGKALRASFTALAQAITRWVQDHADALQQHDPAIPEQLNDRAADNWSPFLAIADEIGGEWPEKARAAAMALSTTPGVENESHGVQLLNDVRSVFDETQSLELRSQDLCKRLAQLDEAPWGSWSHGRPLSTVQLARLLRQFGIRSRDLWQHKRAVKGYVLDDCQDAFDRYLPPLPPGALKREDARTCSRSGDQAVTPSARSIGPCASQSAPIPAPNKGSRVLADHTGEDDERQRARLKELSKLWRCVKPTKPMP